MGGGSVTVRIVPSRRTEGKVRLAPATLFSAPNARLSDDILNDAVRMDPLAPGQMIYTVMQNQCPSHLSDRELMAHVERLARLAREATTDLVAHLAELDARRLYLGAGYPSLFAYCTECLRLSEHGAYNRMEAARVVRRFPVILERLSEGSLNLATVRILAPHLTSENHGELLESACRRSKREVEELVARHLPRPAVPTLVRKLPAPRGSAPSVAGSADPTSDEMLPQVADGTRLPADATVAGPARVSSSSASPPPPPTRPTVRPLAPDRYQIRFTASAETYQKLRQAQELLGHTMPSGDVAMVFDRALSALLADLTRKKVAAAARPRPARARSSASRHIPAQVRRTVWQRDGGRCAFVAESSGLRCSARKPLEFHHVHPYGAGGGATVGNIELRCRNHNAYEAELFYGVKWDGDGEGVIRESSARYGVSGLPNSPRGELMLTRMAAPRRLG